MAEVRRQFRRGFQRVTIVRFVTSLDVHEKRSGRVRTLRNPTRETDVMETYLRYPRKSVRQAACETEISNRVYVAF